MGTTAWKYEGGTWTDATVEWTSDDNWGWREELRSNGFELEPAVRLGDIDVDSLAAEVYAADSDSDKNATGWAVVLTVGDGGDVILIERMPDLLDFMNELSPVVERVLGMNNGAQSPMEREYARLRGLGYPHEVADEASRTFAEEVADYDDDDVDTADDATVATDDQDDSEELDDLDDSDDAEGDVVADADADAADVDAADVDAEPVSTKTSGADKPRRGGLFGRG